MTDIDPVQSRDDPPSLADGQADVAHAEGEVSSSPSASPRRGRRILKRIGLVLLAIAALAAALAVIAYEFGSMEPPSAEMRARYQALVAAGQAPAASKGGFHVPIPGCVCHSPDPVQQVRHAAIPLKDCASCHGGGGAVAAQ